MGYLHKSLWIFLILFIHHVSELSATSRRSTPAGGGRSAKFALMSRSSPNSPFYNASETPYDRIQDAFRRSNLRQAGIRLMKESMISPAKDAQSSITVDNTEYIMRMFIGDDNDRQVVFLIPDTGNFVTWTQCKPCHECFHQYDPIFDPSRSKTFKTIPCTAPECKSLVHYSCGHHDACVYEVAYADGSRSQGTLSVDTAYLDNKAQYLEAFPNFVFGCGHKNSGIFRGRSSGIASLGDHPLSLIRQFGENKFLYCLENLNSPFDGIIIFGERAEATGPDVVTTPVVKKEGHHFYYITLDAITVGGQRLGFADSGKEGNIIIDSGTTMTYLPRDLYNAVAAAVKAGIPDTPLQTTDKLCYKIPEGGVKWQFPEIKASFKGGMDVLLPRAGIFVSPQPGVLCMSILPNAGNTDNIFGYLSHFDHIIALDLNAHTLRIKPEDCQTLF
ncbi:aspartic proteinase CDR1-like [Andrographis paniculata]|uniref:aspartic proteinase CDR1-like n=1 Tax=Andrographis paniculata TaxID=175694 RepID=UPI0021E7AC68|nr:aspartic proteinase CDR1-like [Andrographis paniculata]